MDSFLIYDAGGRKENRYTVLFLEHESGTNTYLGFQLSSNPSRQSEEYLLPQYIRPTRKLGKLVDFEEVPTKVQKVIKKYA